MPDGPDTDHPDDLTDDADDPETASLRPLFPDSNPNTADAWRNLFVKETL